MKQPIRLLFIFFLMLMSATQLKAQIYPQWYCMSHDEIIWDVAFDNTNNIAWLATRGGLVKFDRTTGNKTYYNAANSPLYQNEIKAVEVDNNGNVWIGAYYGDLTMYDGTNWTHYWSLNGVDSLKGIKQIHKDKTGNIIINSASYFTNCMFKYNGSGFTDLLCPEWAVLDFSVDTLDNLWCSVQNALLKYNGINWTQYDSTNSPFTACLINSICADKNNNIWMNVYQTTQPHDNKIYYLNDTTWTYISPGISGIPLNDFCHITSDNLGNTYFYGDINGLTKFDGINFTNFSLASFGLNGTRAYFLELDSTNHFWICPNALLDTSLYEFDGTNTYAHFASNSSLKSDQVRSMGIDHEGNRWFCNYYGGLQKFDGFNWTNYNRSNSNINSDKLGAVGFDNSNNVWVGADGDSAFIPPLAKFDGTNWTTYPLSFFGSSHRIGKILPDKLNNLWVEVFSRGVAKFNGTTWSYWDDSNTGFGGFFAYGMTVDTNNTLWASAYSTGLLKYANNIWTIYTTTNSNLPSIYITNLFTDHSNNIWIVSDLGLSKFDGDSTFINYGANNTFIHGQPRCIAEDYLNNIWIGTDNGVTKYDGTNWTNYDKYNSGLGEFNVWDIKIDKNNTKWICAFDGVWIFNENGISQTYWHNVPEKNFEGTVYYDVNSNGAYDSVAEPGMINQKIICSTDSSASFSNTLGLYRFYKDSGSYISSYIPYANWSITSDSLSYNVTLDTVSLSGFDYGAYPVIAYGALEIDLTSASHRCNAKAPFWIAYQNTGTTISTGAITFVKDDSLQVLVSIPPPDIFSGDTMIWNYTNLMPFESRSIVLNMQNPDVNSINDTLVSYITITDTAGVSSSDSVAQIISCAWDPNEKSVEPIGLAPLNYVFMNDSLEYTICFQNLGNDTAFSVFIIDSIPATMQKDSFVFLASSHAVNIEVSKAGVIRYEFENIMLPSKDINEPASMGYVKYRLKHQPSMPANTQVKNTAYIYFDLNPAIATNTVSNIYINALSTNAQDKKPFSLKAFPNPFNNEIHFHLEGMKQATSSIKIVDLTGRQIFYKKIQSFDFNLNFKNIKAGVYIAEVVSGNEKKRIKLIKN